MCFSCFGKYPGKKIETDQCEMEKAEKYVEEFEQGTKLGEW